MSRIPYPDVASLSPEKRQVIESLGRPLLNVTFMGMHAPDALWRAHYDFKQAMVYATTMDQRLREVLIMRVAFGCQSEYEIHHHMSISANLGFSPQKQAAIRDGRYDELSADERLVAEFTDQVVRDRKPDDATLAQARERFGDPLIIEMLIIIGSYMATTLVVETAGLELDAEPVRGWGASAQEMKTS